MLNLRGVYLAAPASSGDASATEAGTSVTAAISEMRFSASVVGNLGAPLAGGLFSSFDSFGSFGSVGTSTLREKAAEPESEPEPERRSADGPGLPSPSSTTVEEEKRGVQAEEGWVVDRGDEARDEWVIEDEPQETSHDPLFAGLVPRVEGCGASVEPQSGPAESRYLTTQEEMTHRRTQDAVDIV